MNLKLFLNYLVQISESDGIFIIFFIVVSFILIIIFFVLFFFYRKKDVIDKKRRYGKSYGSEFLYIIKKRSGTVYRYNLKDLNHYKTYLYDDFLKLFTLNNSMLFNDYLNVLLTESSSLKEMNETIDYKSKEAIVLLSVTDKGKQSTNHRVVFKCMDVDNVNDIIYLKGTHLFNLPVIETKSKKKIKRVEYHISEIVKLYEDGFFAKGSMFNIRFKKKEGVLSHYNEYELRYIILDSLYKEFKNNKDIYFYFKNEDEFEIDVLDSSFITIYNLNERLKIFIKSIQDTFEKYGYSYIYNYSLSGSLVSELYHEYDKSYEELKKKCLDNFDNNLTFSIFKKEDKNKESGSWIAKTEVIKVIRSQGVEASFRNVYDFKDHHVMNFGYMVNFRSLSVNFQSMDALKKAAKSSNSYKEIFSLCLKKAVPSYIANKENYYSKIFLPISYDEITIALRSLPYIKDIVNAHVVFTFSLNEILDLKDEDEEVIKTLKNIQLKGNEVAFLIKKENYDAIKDNELFNLVDFFIVNLDNEENLKADSKSFLLTHSLLEKLVPFKKVIIVINAKSLTEIELLYRSGVEYFSSDCISGYNTMIQPIDKKIYKKLITMINKN